MKACCSHEGPAPPRPGGHEHHRGHDDHGDHHHDLDAAALSRIGLVALAAAAHGLGAGGALQARVGFDALALGGTLLGGWPVFREALHGLRERRMTMELSMTLALGAALAVGEAFTALVIVLFVLVAEALEGLTMERGERAMHDLLDLLPDRLTVRRDGSDREVASGEVHPGETVVVRPGERVPVDGEVSAGHSFVEEAAITGEPVPAEKSPGAKVFAGSVNLHGVLEVQVERLGLQTAFGRILEAVEEAERSRAPVQRLADLLAGYLVAFALACAAATWLFTGDVRSTISVIIVAGACGVAAGTPLALLGALGQAARHGAIVKGGRFLELLGVVDTVVLDKTGTLTTARPEVTALRPAPGVSAEDLLRAAAVAEARSEHPLGRAVLERARREGLDGPAPDRFHYTPGRGVSCSVEGSEILAGSRLLLEERGLDLAGLPHRDGLASEIAVARDGRVLGLLEVEDPLRPEARGAMEELRRMGIRTVLLTGDAPEVAREVGRRLGVDEAEGGLLPTDKQARVRALVDGGRKVAMVGDGVNDAPALAAATVGIAMGSGTDVARETSDVVLLGNDLQRMARTLQDARRCRGIIWFNFAGTLIVDLVGIGLAACGLLSPILAAFIHVSSEMAFILNSARLLPAGGRLGEAEASRSTGSPAAAPRAAVWP